MIYIPCNLCGQNITRLFTIGKDRFYQMSDTEFPIVRCLSCGLVYQNPQLEPKELVPYYPAEYGPYQDTFTLLKYGPVLNSLKNVYLYLKNRSVVTHTSMSKDESMKFFLDVGCGSGAYLEKMRRLHPRWKLYGLDNNEFACTHTREKGFTVYCGDLIDVDIPENFFDEIWMGQVIEHVPDPKKTIEKLHRLLKKGGVITMATPNIDSIAASIFRSFWFALEVPRHLFLFSPKTISRMLSQSGFKVTNITFDREPKTVIRSIDYLLGGNSVGINPIVWHMLWYLLLPISTLLSFFGKTSIMTVHARKV